MPGVGVGTGFVLAVLWPGIVLVEVGIRLVDGELEIVLADVGIIRVVVEPEVPGAAVLIVGGIVNPPTLELRWKATMGLPDPPPTVTVVRPVLSTAKLLPVQAPFIN